MGLPGLEVDVVDARHGEGRRVPHTAQHVRGHTGHALFEYKGLTHFESHLVRLSERLERFDGGLPCHDDDRDPEEEAHRPVHAFEEAERARQHEQARQNARKVPHEAVTRSWSWGISECAHQRQGMKDDSVFQVVMTALPGAPYEYLCDEE